MSKSPSRTYKKPSINRKTSGDEAEVLRQRLENVEAVSLFFWKFPLFISSIH
jgi:hypothetical protein